MPVPSMTSGPGWRRRRAGTRRDARRARAGDARNAVALDDDVHGTGGRCAGAVDHHDVADRQRRKRAEPFAAAPIGRGNETILLLCVEQRMDDDRQPESQRRQLGHGRE